MKDNGNQSEKFYRSTEEKAVVRESNEGIFIQVNIVSGEAVDRLDARRFERTHGHYFIPEDISTTEVIDEMLSEYTTKESILSGFTRKPGQCYEIMIEADEFTEKNALFRSSKTAELYLPSHSDYIKYIDRINENIEDQLK